MSKVESRYISPDVMGSKEMSAANAGVQQLLMLDLYRDWQTSTCVLCGFIWLDCLVEEVM